MFKVKKEFFLIFLMLIFPILSFGVSCNPISGKSISILLLLCFTIFFTLKLFLEKKKRLKIFNYIFNFIILFILFLYIYQLYTYIEYLNTKAEMLIKCVESAAQMPACWCRVPRHTDEFWIAALVFLTYLTNMFYNKLKNKYLNSVCKYIFLILFTTTLAYSSMMIIAIMIN